MVQYSTDMRILDRQLHLDRGRYCDGCHGTREQHVIGIIDPTTVSARCTAGHKRTYILSESLP